MSLADRLKDWLRTLPAEPTQPTESPSDPGSVGSVGPSADENAFSSGTASWGHDAHYAYLERLGVAEDLGMDVAPGSPAEQIAVHEARRVATGVPVAWPSSRDADVLDALLIHSDALGGLRFVRMVDDAEQVWGGASIAKPPPHRLELPQHRGPDGSRDPSGRAGGR